MLTITRVADTPHVVKDADGKLTHYLGRVDMSLTQPAEPKPATTPEEGKEKTDV